MRNKRLTILCILYFIAGFIAATWFAEDKEVMDGQKVQHLETQIKEYRGRLVDWSRYVYRLENQGEIDGQ